MSTGPCSSWRTVRTRQWLPSCSVSGCPRTPFARCATSSGPRTAQSSWRSASTCVRPFASPARPPG
eukprot:8596352-Lingulodinium_polyedra.AAC.1